MLDFSNLINEFFFLKKKLKINIGIIFEKH